MKIFRVVHAQNIDAETAEDMGLISEPEQFMKAIALEAIKQRGHHAIGEMEWEGDDSAPGEAYLLYKSYTYFQTPTELDSLKGDDLCEYYPHPEDPFSGSENWLDVRQVRKVPEGVPVVVHPFTYSDHLRWIASDEEVERFEAAQEALREAARITQRGTTDCLLQNRRVILQGKNVGMDLVYGYRQRCFIHPNPQLSSALEIDEPARFQAAIAAGGGRIVTAHRLLTHEGNPAAVLVENGNNCLTGWGIEDRGAFIHIFELE